MYNCESASAAKEFNTRVGKFSEFSKQLHSKSQLLYPHYTFTISTKFHWIHSRIPRFTPTVTTLSSYSSTLAILAISFFDLPHTTLHVNNRTKISLWIFQHLDSETIPLSLCLSCSNQPKLSKNTKNHTNGIVEVVHQGCPES